MKINELIERLQEIAESHPDAKVMLATQPGYPIAETLRGVANPDDEVAPRDYDGGQIDPSAWDPEHGPGVVWLVSGGQPTSHEVSPYAPAWVFQAAS